MQLKPELRNQWLNPLRSENYSLKKGYFIIFPRKLTETLKIYPDSKNRPFSTSWLVTIRLPLERN